MSSRVGFKSDSFGLSISSRVIKSTSWSTDASLFRSIYLRVQSLWTPAQRKRASRLYFANVFLLIFYSRLILRPRL